MKKVFICVGTRPNFIKITQFERCLKDYPQIQYYLVHTGQHHDYNMSDVFFNELKLKTPDFFLNIHGGSQIELSAKIMVAFEKLILEEKPDLVLVPGDVNSSFACAFAASRNSIPLGHIESGLRSFDKTMPEEINRIMIDDVSDLFFVTEKSGLYNLEKEGKDKAATHFVGNTMIDTLVAYTADIDASKVLEQLNIAQNIYSLFTFHRPANVDNKENLEKLLELVSYATKFGYAIFPIHPRTKQRLIDFGLEAVFNNPKIIFSPPLGYFDFLKLVKNAKAVITDSGGIQEETTFLQVPCLTVRPNTERPITCEIGSNTLVELDIKTIANYLESIHSGTYKKGIIPELWDGKSTERICKAMAEYLGV
jgi:UDP-N-acetylglucosamine 2-epimerase (non-hydrolysing)